MAKLHLEYVEKIRNIAYLESKINACALKETDTLENVSSFGESFDEEVGSLQEDELTNNFNDDLGGSRAVVRYESDSEIDMGQSHLESSEEDLTGSELLDEASSVNQQSHSVTDEESSVGF